MHLGDVNLDSLLLLCNYDDCTHGKLYRQLDAYLAPLRRDPVAHLLTFKEHSIQQSLEDLFIEVEAAKENGPEATAHLLLAILTAQVEPAFYKINVHAAMTPVEIKKLFEPIISLANELQCMYLQKVQNEKADTESTTPQSSSVSYITTDSSLIPFVTVRVFTFTGLICMLGVSSCRCFWMKSIHLLA